MVIHISLKIYFNKLLDQIKNDSTLEQLSIIGMQTFLEQNLTSHAVNFVKYLPRFSLTTSTVQVSAIDLSIAEISFFKIFD